MKAWEAYNKPATPIANMSGFLYQISRNMVIDHYRGKEKAKMVSFDDVPMVADMRTNVHERAAISADIEQVKLALQKIKKDYQDVLILHYLEDVPVAEVAAILGRSEGSVRVMVHRGLNALREEMSQQA
jgi:RNA polymerase sigma-70 factor (ECF subfamily)